MENEKICWLEEVGLQNISQVGGKCASLGQMYSNMKNLGVRVPNGYVITTRAYEEFIKYNGLNDKIDNILGQIDTTNLINLHDMAIKIRLMIKSGNFPEDTQNLIIKYYKDLSAKYYDNKQYGIDVAVRSSSTAEDLIDASFAGQQETYLNVRGENQLIESIKKCFASLYTDRAISYRKSVKYMGELKIAVCIQKMVRSDIGSAGVAFSLDPETGLNKIIVINGSWGLGEMVVQGSIKPDEFVLYKESLKNNKKGIIDKKLGDKTHRMIYSTNPDEKVIKIKEDETKYYEYCLTDDKIVELGNWIINIEQYYNSLYDNNNGIDIEWALDGITDELFIVQARPETIHSNKLNNTEYQILKNKDTILLLEGIAVGNLIGQGKVRIIHTLDSRHFDNDMIDFDDGDILVTDITDPDWEPIMKRASAIVTNKGGRTSHCAIIARELGICAVVGCINATEKLKNNDYITVSCAEGEIGNIYKGKVDYTIKNIDMENLPNIETNLMLNIASPDSVFKYHNLPVKGVGLVREEFIINNYIKIHPHALLNYKNIDDIQLKNNIDNLILNHGTEIDKDIENFLIEYNYDPLYNIEAQYYIKKLSYGLSKIAVTFDKYDVIVRFSDFKSNEYRGLMGGKYFEPYEENPMIGWRGASRYYSDKFMDYFGLECIAIKYVREIIGLKNVIVMIPFCRTIDECKNVLNIMEKYGLKRGENNLKIYIMCEIPNNVILASKFCKYIDGMSIGSNDLTQLTLGLDRDSELVAKIYDERNEGVKKMISIAIKKCKKYNVKIGICGQGPSDFPDFTEFLVKKGIDSISVTPDSAVNTIHIIANAEKELK